MPVGIVITVAPQQAVDGVKTIGTALTGLETQGKTTGDAIGAGLDKAGQKAADAAAKINGMKDTLGGLAGVGTSLSKLTDQFEREADMLNRINGPMREYDANLQALDMLLQKNTISTSQYADQVTRLNTALDKTKPAPVAPPSMGDPLKGAASGGASQLMGGLGMAGGAIGAALGVLKLSDSYEQLQNRMRPLATSESDLNAKMDQQAKLADQIRTPMAATINTTRQLTDATEDMGLSQDQVIDLTREIGTAAKLAGGDLETMQGAIEQLAYGFANGTMGGRELKTVMRDMPEIGNAMTTEFGKTRKEIIEMANAGKISGADITRAMRDASDTMDAKLGKTVPTLGEKWDSFKDTVSAGANSIVGVAGDIVDALSPIDHMMTEAKESADNEARALKAWGDNFQRLVDVQTTFAAGGPAGVQASRDGTKSIKDQALAVDALADKYRALHVATMQAATSGTQTSGVEFNLRSTQAVGDLNRANVDAETTAYRALQEAMDPALKTMNDLHDVAKRQEYAKEKDDILALHEPTSQMTIDLQKLDDKFSDLLGFKAAESTLHNMTALLADAAKKTQELTAKAEALVAIASKPTGNASKDRQNVNNATDATRLKKEDADPVQKTLDDLHMVDRGETYNATVDNLKDAMNQGRETAQQYATDLAKVNKEYQDIINPGGESAMAKLFTSITGPTKEWGINAAALDELMRRGLITLQQYNVEAAKLEKTKPPDVAMLHNAFGVKGNTERQDSSFTYAASTSPFGADAHTGSSDPFSMAVKPLDTEVPQIEAQVKALADQKEALRAIATPSEKYATDLARINKDFQDGKDNPAGYARAIADLHTRFADVSGEEQYEKKLNELDDKLLGGIDSLDEYTLAKRNLDMSMNQATVGEGMLAGLDAIKKSIDPAADAMKLMTGAFGDAENALTSFVTTGKVNFDSFTKSLLSDLTKLLEQQALKGLMSMLGGGSGAGSASSGTSFAGILSSVAGLFGGGGGAAAGAADAGDGIAGMTSAVGSLAFATGGSFMVGGSGGTDSQSIAMRVTPGERVSVQTPDQQRAASTRTTAAPPSRGVRNVNIFDPAAVPAAMDSRAGERVQMNVLTKNNKTIRGHITRR